MATTSTRHNRSLSPSGRFCSSTISTSSSFATSCSSFSSSSNQPPLFHRSSSPTRVNMYGTNPSPSPSVRFSIDNNSNSHHHHRSISPGKSISAVNKNRTPFPAAAAGRKKISCLCSPTTHPGSFRCSYHKALDAKQRQQQSTYSPNRLNMRRSAMTNSLVRIGTVEGGEWERRALATLIRPCAHQQRRRADFRPRPSRLSIMSKAGDDEI